MKLYLVVYGAGLTYSVHGAFLDEVAANTKCTKEARNHYDPDNWRVLEEELVTETTGAQARPAPSFENAYQGAMEEVAIWKKRALEAEKLNRRFVAEINGHTHMEEPVQPAPSVPDDVIEQAVTRFLSWKLPKDFKPDGGLVFIPTKGRGYDSPHWPIGTNLFTAEQAREMLRYALAAAPEAKP